MYPFKQRARYADDATATGTLTNLCTWWDKFTVGPSYGHFVKAVKTWFITKDETHAKALDVFQGTKIRITKEGKPHLEAALGTTSYVTECKSQNWSLELASIVNMLHSQFLPMVYKQMGLCGKNYPQHCKILKPLTHLLRTKFIPSLTGHAALSDLERELLALPAHRGGLGISNPSQITTSQYSASMKVTQPLVDLIIKQDDKYEYEILQGQLTAKAISP